MMTKMKIKECDECMRFLRSDEGDKIINAVADIVDNDGREYGVSLVAVYMTGYHRRGHARLVTF